MKNDNISTGDTPMLFPMPPDQFWQSIREIVREEIKSLERLTGDSKPVFETSGLTYKPLYKMEEICKIFYVSKPTIYEWIKHGKLKPFKVRSRVYFLWQDIQLLLQQKEK